MSIENLKISGRIVGGDITAFEQATDFYTKQPKLDKNGQPLKEHRIDLAVTKAEFMQKVWPYVLQEVVKVYPQCANANPEQLDMTRFAWKIINGDSPACPQGSNVPYNTRDGYAGCYIIKIRTSAYLPTVYKWEGTAYRKIEKNEIKTGDFINANLNISVHTEKDGGLYWNPNAYEITGYGQAIKGSTGGDPMKLFGGQTPTLPQGASATPISSAPANATMPMTPQAVAMPATQPSQPVAMPATQPSQPVAMPAPAYDFVQNAGMPQAQPAATNWNMPTQPTAVFNQPVASAAAQQQSAPQAAATTAPFVTTFPSR